MIAFFGEVAGLVDAPVSVVWLHAVSAGGHLRVATAGGPRVALDRTREGCQDTITFLPRPCPSCASVRACAVSPSVNVRSMTGVSLPFSMTSLRKSRSARRSTAVSATSRLPRPPAPTSRQRGTPCSPRDDPGPPGASRYDAGMRLCARRADASRQRSPRGPSATSDNGPPPVSLARVRGRPVRHAWRRARQVGPVADRVQHPLLGPHPPSLPCTAPAPLRRALAPAAAACRPRAAATLSSVASSPLTLAVASRVGAIDVDRRDG